MKRFGREGDSKKKKKKDLRKLDSNIFNICRMLNM